MASRANPRPAAGADRWFGIKTRIHAKLLTVLTPEQLRSLNKEGVREQLGVNIERIVPDEGIPLNAGERDRLVEEVLDEVFGLGPLEALMKDATISDIMVNGPDSIYVERNGKVVETSVRFKDTAHVRTIIDRIVSNIGRRIDDSSPIVDARLGDGSRVCAVIPPLSLNGPVMSIRRFGKKLLTVEDLIRLDTFTPGIIDFLAGAALVAVRSNAAGFDFQNDVQLRALFQQHLGNGEVFFEGNHRAIEHVALEQGALALGDALAGGLQQGLQEGIHGRGMAVIRVQGDEDIVFLREAMRGLGQHNRTEGFVAHAGAGSELAAACGNLDDAIRFRFRKGAQGSIDGGDAGDIDRRIGVTTLLSGIEHGTVLSRSSNWHGDTF